MSLESPPRLKLEPELGPILRAADHPISAERIASNGAAVKATIAAGVVKATLPLWKIGLPLLLIAGAIVVQRQVDRADDRVVAPGFEIVEAHIEPIEIPVTSVTRVEPPPPERAPTRVPESPSQPAIVAAPVEPTPSDLPEQIRLYEAARAASLRGEVALGLETLDELLRRFPRSQLRAEAELTRAELLVRGDRLAEAATSLEALAADPAHRGRRGELLRTLGDVRRKQGDCARAIEAYTRARTMTLSAAEKSKIDRGMERCARP